MISFVLLSAALLTNALEVARTVEHVRPADGTFHLNGQVTFLYKPETGKPETGTRCWRLAARGFSNKDIAERLDISLPGVKKHFSTIFVRLGAANRAEAVCIAGQKHLLG